MLDVAAVTIGHPVLQPFSLSFSSRRTSYPLLEILFRYYCVRESKPKCPRAGADVDTREAMESKSVPELDVLFYVA